MAQEYTAKDLQGALFKNDKGDNEKRPDYRGNAMIGGIKYFVSAWIEKPQNGGAAYMSMSYQKDDGSRGQR